MKNMNNKLWTFERTALVKNLLSCKLVGIYSWQENNFKACWIEMSLENKVQLIYEHNIWTTTAVS